MQAAVGGDEQYTTSGAPESLFTRDGKQIDTVDIDEGILSEIQLDEETGLECVEVIEDTVDHKKGDKLYLTNPLEVDEQNVPQAPGPGGMDIPVGGVGGPMPMASPYKNYKNPQDYKVFNWGNKPTPFEKRKKY